MSDDLVFLVKSEREFQRAFKKWMKDSGLFFDNVHPSAGMASGVPDTFVWDGDIRDCAFTELKVAERVTDLGFKLKHDIRPSQRLWHKKYWRHNGASGVVAGLFINGSWQCYKIKRKRIQAINVKPAAFVYWRDAELIEPDKLIIKRMRT